MWICGRGSSGGVNLTPSSPRALRRFSLVSSFCHWAAKLHLCTSTSGEAIGSTWRKRIERHSAHFFPPPLLTSMSGQTLQAVFEKGSDQLYLYTWALKSKTVIVSSRCKGFMGILLTAVVKILSFDCHAIEKKTEKTWGCASTSLRLRPCMFLSDLG